MFLLLIHFSRGQNRKSRSSVFFCSETKRKRLLCSRASLLLRRFVIRMAEASAKRVTGDEPQGTMGRVQTGLPAFLCAHIFIKRETSGYEAAAGRPCYATPKTQLLRRLEKSGKVSLFPSPPRAFYMWNHWWRRRMWICECVKLSDWPFLGCIFPGVIWSRGQDLAT